MAIKSITSNINNSPSIGAKRANVLQQSYGLNGPAFGSLIRDVKNESTIKYIEKLATKFTSDWNRVVMGVTAIVTQPFFDLYNKRVDEDTRIVSCARTIAKIVVGTAVGFAVRNISLRMMGGMCKTAATEAGKAAGNLLKEAKSFSKKEQWFVPKKYANASLKEMNNYKNAMGTIIGTTVGLFTNFLIDAPVTVVLTNVLTSKYLKPKANESTSNSVAERGKS